MTLTRPPSGCPKCGSQFGFLYSMPTYRAAQRVDPSQWGSPPPREWLEWACRCGYTVRTPTADAHLMPEADHAS